MGRLTVIATIILFALLPMAGAEKQALLLDRSGSMKPYYEHGLMGDLASSIGSIMGPPGRDADILAFGTDVVSLRNVEGVNALPYSNFTYLDRAIDHVIQNRYSIVWLVTDNVQDQPGAAEVGNTEVFYRRLRSDAVRRVVIFPILQPAGHSGIVVYALLLGDGEGKQTYEKEIADFVSQGHGTFHTEALRMKPLDKDTVEIVFTHRGAGPEAEQTYPEGTPIHQELDIRFRSRFEHLEIADASIQIPNPTPEFQKGSLLQPEKREISITPQKVTRLGAGGETEQVYKVSIDLGSARLKRDLPSLWRAAWGKNAEDATLNLAFLIQVPQENFHMRNSFLATYNASSLAEAHSSGRVYALNSLPMLMSESTTAVQAQTPLTFRIKYPWWPAVLFVLLILAAIGLVLGIIIGLKKAAGGMGRAKDWAVTSESDRNVPLRSEIDAQQNVRVQGDRIGLLEKNTFVPAPGVTLERNEPRKHLQDKMRFKVQCKDRSMFLTFSEKVKNAATTMYTPGKR